MITLEQAKDHLRLDEDDPLLETVYLPAALEWVSQYLNRKIFNTAEDLAMARANANGAIATASTNLEAELTAAYDVTDPLVREAMVDMANQAWRNAHYQYREVTQGTLTNPAIDAATLLVMADMYENREGSFVGISYQPNPAVISLLAPYRVGMGV